jgi:alpha-galactosidase
MATFRLATAAALLFGQATASPQAQMFERRQVGGEEPDVVIPGASSYNGLNLVPQMGWNNWNAFHCDVNESLLLTTAQDMINYGLRDLGYSYIVLDDCWAVGRNESGYLVEDSKYSYGDSTTRPADWRIRLQVP